MKEKSEQLMRRMSGEDWTPEARDLLMEIRSQAYEALGMPADQLSIWRAQVAAYDPYLDDPFMPGRISIGAPLDPLGIPLLPDVIHGDRVVLHSLLSQLLQAANDLGLTVDWRIHFSTVPSGRMSGTAYRVPGTGEVIITIDSGLLKFIEFMAVVVASLFRRQEHPGGWVRLEPSPELVDEKPEITEYVGELLTVYLKRGEFLDPPPFAVPEELTDGFVGLRSSASLFALGHELAHATCGHLSESKPTVAVDTRDEIRLTWENEMEADAQGAAIGMAAMKNAGHGIQAAYHGADFLMSVLDLFERARQVLLRSKLVNRASRDDVLKLFPTHPPGWFRQGALRLFLLHHYGSRSNGAIAVGEKIQQCSDAIWDRLFPHFRELHDSGIRPFR